MWDEVQPCLFTLFNIKTNFIFGLPIQYPKVKSQSLLRSFFFDKPYTPIHDHWILHYV